MTVQSENETQYFTKCQILGQLWVDFREDEEFADFMEYNDLGLPIAFAIANGIVNDTPLSNATITETWDIFLAGLDIKDTGFETLEDVLGFRGE
jgi:hypothetical protein